MIDSDPIQLHAEVSFHLPHQIAHEWLQLGQLTAVIRSDDESELVSILLASPPE